MSARDLLNGILRGLPKGICGVARAPAAGSDRFAVQTMILLSSFEPRFSFHGLWVALRVRFKGAFLCRFGPILKFFLWAEVAEAPCFANPLFVASRAVRRGSQARFLSGLCLPRAFCCALLLLFFSYCRGWAFFNPVVAAYPEHCCWISCNYGHFMAVHTADFSHIHR